MAEDHDKEKVALCPVGKFFYELEKSYGKQSKFCEHLAQSKMELLKAFKSLLDEKIDDMEKKEQPDSSKKVTKIKVE